MRQRVWALALVALVAASCSDARSEASAPSSSVSSVSAVDNKAPTEPAEVGSDVGEADPLSVKVLLRGAVASVGDGPLRVCRTSTPAQCLDSIELVGVSWADLPVEPWAETWGRWHPDRLEIDGLLQPDGQVLVAAVRSETVVPPAGPDCPGRTADYPVVGGLTFDDVRRAIVDYTLSIGDRLGGDLTFDSRRGITLIRVVDDPAPHQEALDALVPGRTCVTQVANGRQVLGTLRDRLEALVEEWADRGYGDATVSDPPDVNLVVVDAPRIDRRLWDDLGDQRHLVWVRAQVEALGDDLVDALDRVVPPPLEADSNRLFIGCRGVPIDPAIFETPADDHLDDHPSTAVFEQTAMPGVPQAGEASGWWRAYESPNRVLYVSTDFGALEVFGRADAWGWVGSGGCQPAPVDPLGMVVMAWQRAPDSASTGNELSLVVTAPGCPGSEPDDLSPLVDETDGSVTVTVLRRPYGDTEICAHVDSGPIAVPITVALDAPLGDRQLLDGGQYPAALIG